MYVVRSKDGWEILVSEVVGYICMYVRVMSVMVW